MISSVCLLATGLWLGSALPNILWISYGACVMALGLQWRFPQWLRGHGMALVNVLLGIILIQSALHFPHPSHHVSNYRSASPQLCAARIDGTVQRYDSNWRVSAALLRCEAGTQMQGRSGRIELRGDFLPAPSLAPGDQVRFRSPLRAPRVYWNAGTAQRRWRYRSEHIDAIVYIGSAPALRVLETGGFSVRGLLGQWRQQLSDRFAIVHDPFTRALLRAVVLGEGGALHRDQWEQFRRLGAVHLLVVSGLHVGVIAWLCVWALRALLWCVPTMRYRPSLWRWTLLCGLLCGWLFAGISGHRIPALRAMLMLSCWAIAKLLHRPGDGLRALALSMWVILVLQPAALMTASFQLSCTAVFAVLTLPSIGRQQTQWHTRILAILYTSLWSGLWITLWVTPIILWHYQGISLLSVVSNLLFFPWIIGIFLAGGLGLLWIAPFLPTLSQLWAQSLGSIGEKFQQFLAWVDHGSSWWNIHAAPSPVSIIALFGILMLLRFPRVVPVVRKAHWRVLLLCIASVVCIWPWLPHDKETLRLHVLDVGHGTAVHIALPNGKHYLYDAGGTANPDFDFGAAVVVPSLRRLGVRELDTVIISHFHPDHFGGLRGVQSAFPVRRVLTHAGRPPAEYQWDTMQHALESSEITQQQVHQGMMWREGAVEFRILHPAPAPLCANENNCSVVIELRYGDTRMLLAGDIEAPIEAQLVGDHRHESANVLLVPHHGSRTSSTAAWLDLVQPELALVSVGKRFGLPHPDVMARYRQAGTAVYRTDHHGAIHVKITPQKWWVDTAIDRRPE